MMKRFWRLEYFLLIAGLELISVKLRKKILNKKEEKKYILSEGLCNYQILEVKSLLSKSKESLEHFYSSNKEANLHN